MISEICKHWYEPKNYVGKYVMVTDCSIKTYFKYNLEGHKGHIRNYRSTTGSPCLIEAFAVEIEGKENPKSEKGLFWLKPNDLTIIENKKETDNMALNLDNVMEGYKICEAYFKSDREVFYGIYYGEVDTPSLAVVQLNGRRELATIIRTNVPEEEFKQHNGILAFEVIGTVDDSAYNERKDKIKKRAEIKEKMMERAAKFKEEQFWKMIASEDAEMAELLKEYDKYGK